MDDVLMHLETHGAQGAEEAVDIECGEPYPFEHRDIVQDDQRRVTVALRRNKIRLHALQQNAQVRVRAPALLPRNRNGRGLHLAQDVHERERAGVQVVLQIHVLPGEIRDERRVNLVARWCPQEKTRRTDLDASAFHLVMPSDTDRMSARGCLRSFRCVASVRWRRKSAGAASSSVISRMIPSGRSEGWNIWRSRDVCKSKN
jgi:hypothetical protein